MDFTEDGDQDKPKEVIRKKRKTGSRCIAYGCSNTLYTGFIMHVMPGKMPVGEEQFDNVQKQWITFIGKKRKFDEKDAKTYCKIFVCSGHFVREDYEQSQVEMYRRGLRTRPPSLKKCSLPTLNIAEQPFPSDWFLPSPTSLFSLPSSSSSSSSSSSPTGTCTYSTTTSTSCTVSTPALHEHLPPSSDSPSPLHTSHEPDIPKRSRKESIYIRKRDVDALYIDYFRHADEERSQDILDSSKGVHCAVRNPPSVTVSSSDKATHLQTMQQNTSVNEGTMTDLVQSRDASTQWEQQPPTNSTRWEQQPPTHSTQAGSTSTTQDLDKPSCGDDGELEQDGLGWCSEDTPAVQENEFMDSSEPSDVHIDGSTIVAWSIGDVEETTVAESQEGEQSNTPILRRIKGGMIDELEEGDYQTVYVKEEYLEDECI